MQILYEKSHKPVNLAPQSLIDEVIQNISTIISTPKGSVVLDRNFGIDTSYLDKPITVAKMLYSVALVEAIRDYEPRAIVKIIDFKHSGDNVSTLEPTLRIDIDENIS